MRFNGRRIAVAAAAERTDRKDVADVLRCRDAVSASLDNHGWRPFDLDVDRWSLMSGNFVSELLSSGAACVFNLFEGFADDPGAESVFAGMLEKTEIPFTGNGSRTLEQCLDKDMVRRKLRQNGLPVSPGTLLLPGEGPEKLLGLRWPLFVKPCFEDGSVGIDSKSLVRSPDDLEALLKTRMRSFPGGLVVEEFLSGKEYNVGFLGEYPYEPTAVSSMRFGSDSVSGDFLGYDSKWMEESPGYRMTDSVVEEDVEPRRREWIIHLAREAGRLLGCRGYFRVDLREKAASFTFWKSIRTRTSTPTAVSPGRAVSAATIMIPWWTGSYAWLWRAAKTGMIAKSEITRLCLKTALATKTFSASEIEVLQEVLADWSNDSATSYRLVTAPSSEKEQAGFLIWGKIPMTEKAYDLYWIAVDPARQRKGTGRLLVSLLEDAVRKEGGGVIRAETSGSSAYEGQRVFYRRCGFKECGMIADFYSKGEALVTYCKTI